MSNVNNTRIERDSMGEMSVPTDAYYGASTMRAVLNFPISGRPVPWQVIHAFALLKRACAETNVELKKLDRRRSGLIVRACDEIIAGQHAQEFIVTLLEGSGGTSINMNTNEVIANRALQISGCRAGDYDSIHPNEHVNLGQSTNDVVPSAIKLPPTINPTSWLNRLARSPTPSSGNPRRSPTSCGSGAPACRPRNR